MTMDADALEGARRLAEDDWPQHKKLAAIPDDERQAVGDFIEWFKSRGYELAEWTEAEQAGIENHCKSCTNDDCMGNEGTEVMVPAHAPHMRTTQSILATYYGVSENELEREKRLMLAGLRLRDHQREVLSKQKRVKIEAAS